MNPGTRDITIGWDNVGMVGDEVLEFWFSANGAPWALDSTAPVGAGATQEQTFTLDAGVVYAGQIRPGRGGIYTDAYLSADPEDWPAGSRTDFSAGLPAIALLTEWERTSNVSEQINVSWTNDDPSRAVRLWRKIGAGAFALVHTVPAGESDYVYILDSGTEAEVELHFYVDQENDEPIAGPPSNVRNQWGGPNKPLNYQQYESTGFPDDYMYTMIWDQGTPGASTEIYDSYLCGAIMAHRSNAGIDDETFTDSVEQNAPGPEAYHTVLFQSEARHKLTQFGVDDFSDRVNGGVEIDIFLSEDAYHSCP